MARFNFSIVDQDGVSRKSDAFDAISDGDAVNIAMNALSQFACSRFPPPEEVRIKLRDARNLPVAELSFAFEVSYFR
jgi:hypothetical protein